MGCTQVRTNDALLLFIPDGTNFRRQISPAHYCALMSLPTLFTAVATELRGLADAEAAVPMSAYIRDQFAFLGVKSAARRLVSKPLLTMAKTADADSLLAVAATCWELPEREFQYVGADLLRAGAGALRAADLDSVRTLIETRSWWDTVDSLAAWTVGPMVANHRQLATEMDRWIDDSNVWVARTAILHQLGYKARTDADQLFGYVLKRSADTDFFIRKASGWALRQYGREDPDAVRAFVAEHAERLSSLTSREALKRLG